MITTNNGLTLSEGGSASLAARLVATDAATDDDTIIYTVTDGPDNGSLSRSTFTKAQLNAGSVKYTHDGTNTTSDSFTFKVADTNGNERTALTFSITVNAVDDDTPTATSTPMATPEASSGPTETTASEATPTLEPTETPDTIVITIQVSDLPKGTKAIELPNGEVVELGGSDTLDIEIGVEYLSDDGFLELTALDEEGMPLGIYIANGIAVPDTGSASSIWLVLMWVLIGIGIVGAAGLAAYLVLQRDSAHDGLISSIMRSR